MLAALERPPLYSTPTINTTTQITIHTAINGATNFTHLPNGMPATASDFSKVYPDVFVDISSGDMSATLMMLVRGEVDMALSFGPIENVSLQRRSFTRGPICAIVPKDHPLNDFTSIPIKALAQHRLIALTNSYGIQRFINKMFESENVVFTPAYRCNQQSVAIALCQAGLGVGFMTAQALW